MSSSDAAPRATYPAPSPDPAKLKVGDRLPTLTKHPTTRQLVKYAGASGDFYEIHYDDSYAKGTAGLPGVILHGLLKAAWLGELVSTWAGPDAFVRRVEASYRGLDLPGVPFRLEGTITSLETESDGSTLVELEVWGESADGTRSTPGSATVQLFAQRWPQGLGQRP
jgi:acyl dehydratase